MSNVQSVHLQALNVSNFEVAQLVVIQVQVISWKSHNYIPIYWGFFGINDGLHVDLESL
jgi:uncharacterized membrane protein